MITKQEALEKFNSLPIEIIMTVDSDEVSAGMFDMNLKYGVDVSALIIFVIVGELELDKIDDYLMREFELDKEKATVAKKDITNRIFNPLIKRIAFLSANSNKDLSLQDEVQIIREIFLSNVVNEIKSNPVIVHSVNARMFFVLGNDFSAKKDFERNLFVNQEKIAHLTITDWLKDFISQKGSAIFDDVTLTDYTTHSPNCQKLNDADRRLVRKLLILYRNLKFFPESMPNDTGEGWEIIPIDDEVREFNRETLSVPKTVEERHIEVMQAESRQYEEDSLEKKAIEEEINMEKRVEGLRIMAKRYPEGSLEWRAIMDEVRKLS